MIDALGACTHACAPRSARSNRPEPLALAAAGVPHRGIRRRRLRRPRRVSAVAGLSPGVSLSRFQVGLLLPAVYVGGLIVSMPAGQLADRFGARICLVGGLALSGVLLALAAGVTVFAGLLGCLLVAGIGWSIVNPAIGRAIIEIFPASERGLAMGIKQMGLTVGGIASAVVLPSFAAWWGWRSALALCAVVALVPVAVGWRPMRPLAGPVPDEAGDSAHVGVIVVVAASSAPRLLFAGRPGARDDAVGGARLSTALRHPGAAAHSGRGWMAARLRADRRHGGAPGPRLRQRPLARGPAHPVAGGHLVDRRPDHAALRVARRDVVVAPPWPWPSGSGLARSAGWASISC